MCGLVWLNKHFAEDQKALRKGACEGRQLKEDVGGGKPFTKLMENSQKTVDLCLWGFCTKFIIPCATNTPLYKN